MNPELLGATLGTGLGAAFMIGLSFGSGPCNLTCLPYLGPVLMGPAAQRPFHAVILPFMLGRLLGYMGLGALAGGLGIPLKEGLAHPLLPVLVAVLTGWLAWRLFWQSGKAVCTAQPASPPSSPSSIVQSAQLIATDAPEQPTRNRLQLLLLGGSLAMNPCLPLLGLLAAAAQSADPLVGSGLALAFGLGAVLIPTLLVRYGVALLGQQLREQLSRWQTTLARTGAALLMLLAINSGWYGIPGLAV